MKPLYICGPLTDMPDEMIEPTKRFYERLADMTQRVMGVRAFVPHEHFDPVKHARFTPQQVDEAERRQVCEKSSGLVVCAIAPSWGGGIEVEMAFRSGIPSFILWPDSVPKLSRLLRGNPSVADIIHYKDPREGERKLKDALRLHFPQAA